MYYGIDGAAPNRIVTFEFYMSHYQLPNEYYHFQARFFEGMPNIVQYVYFSISDGGRTCTVGAQGRTGGSKSSLLTYISTIGVLASSGGSFLQYSFNALGSVFAGLTLTFDTSAGTYTTNPSGSMLDQTGG